ncbi:hypothetical protein [Silvanigrella paludirubra]|uniref:hypothetical protein n=1 Tax=Silvanigrella paludirubra TaxID=2499159 RepID=UPI001296DB6E|nr:hypothetical protein [Silvanigrella paludirubra]
MCIILDTFSISIIGWSMQDNLKRELGLNSLNIVFQESSEINDILNIDEMI